MKTKKIIKKLEELGFYVDSNEVIYIDNHVVTYGSVNYTQAITVNDIKQTIKDQTK